MRYLELDEWATHSDKIDKVLKDKGYKFLGKGIDMSAWKEPKTGMVLKIFGTNKTTNPNSKDKKTYFSDDHRMFFNWAKFCEGNNNPFLPKFYGFESFVFEGRVYLQIRTEFLTRVPTYRLDECLEGLSGYAEFYPWSTFENVELSSADQRSTWEPLFKIMPMDQVQYLYKTIKVLKNLSTKYGYKLDLHSENFMMRGKTPIINDPWTVRSKDPDQIKHFLKNMIPAAFL